MAEERSQLPGAISKGSKLWDLWQGYNAAEAMAAGGLSQGMPYPGAISGAVPDAFAGGLSAISAAPFFALAAMNVLNMYQTKTADRPTIGFMGLTPKYGYANGKYVGPNQGDDRSATVAPSSKKYNYAVSVVDTGKDPEVAKQVIQYFDNYFDKLAAQGVPVNEMLKRNKDFKFGRDASNFNKMVSEIEQHFKSDISAYKAGKKPPERQIKIEPTGTIGELSGRYASDMNIRNRAYNVTLSDTGTEADRNITLSPNDPRVKLIQAARGKGYSGRDSENLPRGVSLTPGYTYTVDYGNSPGTGRMIQERGLPTRPYTAPEKSGGYTMPVNEPKWYTDTAVPKSNTAAGQAQGGNNMADSPVRDLYKELFNRPQPDQGGLDFWEGLWDTGNYTEDQMRDAMREAGRQWTKSPGGTQWIHNTTGESAPDFDGVPVAPGATIPDNIPSGLQPGLEGFVNDSWDITRQYRETADQLWSDYLDFEKTYFNKFENNQQQYKDNLSSMPHINLKMPGTMGGATVPLAPKVHSAMYTDQFNAMNTGIGNQANASLAGLGSRDSLAKNIFATNLNNLQNSFLPTQVGLDLYNLERAGQLGIDRAEAGKYTPSTMSTWAPVVGSLLQSDFGSSAAEGLWDFGTDLVSSGWDYVSGLFA